MRSRRLVFGRSMFDAFPVGCFKGIRRGVERECLRVSGQGRISQVSHPFVLGAPLTHPEVTTDYAEALLELVTPPCDSVEDVWQYLFRLHSHVFHYLDDELLWVGSMPCAVADPSEIMIARYGSSHIARMKEIYRQGLCQRYGSLMQVIAGLHFNVSFPQSVWQVLYEQSGSFLSFQDFVTQRYFGLIRNFLRFSWVLPFLFGASPVVDQSFVKSLSHGLKPLGKESFYLPFATSLRMSDLGYHNSFQDSLSISSNDLEGYLHGLQQAMSSPVAAYGAFESQLSDSILQIENEYYSVIRPKSVHSDFQRPSNNLRRFGVEYVEVRLLDLDPFESLGISQSQMLFMESFLLFCLLQPSPDLSFDEQKQCRSNFEKVVLSGREPGLSLQLDGQSVSFVDEAKRLLDGLVCVAERLQADCGEDYVGALVVQRRKLDDFGLTPSARVLEAVGDGSYVDWVLQRSSEMRDFFGQQLVDKAFLQKFDRSVLVSHEKKKLVEASDLGSLDSFIQAYFAESV